MSDEMHDSDNESTASTTSNDSQPRTTRKSTSRLAKKSTGAVQETMQMQPITRRQAAMANRDKAKFTYSDTNTREKRKLEKKIQVKKLFGCINDSRGFHINSGKDMCDCLDLACSGCFFPCKKCSSMKCGVECRINRKNKYESIEYHGYNLVKKNPLEK